MKKRLVVSALATVALGTFSAGASAAVANAFIAACTPSQETPGTPTPTSPLQSCVATFYVTNPDTVRYSIRCNNITTNITAAHIHPGTADQTGSPIFNFNATATAPFNGILAEGAIRRSALGDVVFDDLLDKMRSDNAYVNVHTTANGAGEVRGQVTPFVVPKTPALPF